MALDLGQRVGGVHYDVLPNTSKFASYLNRDIRKLTRKPIEIPVKANTKAFAAAMARATKTKPIEIPVKANTKNLSSQLSKGAGARGFASVGMKMGDNLKAGIMKPIGGLPGIIAGLVGVGAFSAAKKFADATGDMNETVSKTRTIFGGSSKAIEAWARNSVDNLGMSNQAALEGASAFGNLFDQIGISSKASIKMSKGFVQMATDAASFSNANPAEVMDAFQSATRGEYDALQRFIPTLNAATVEAKANKIAHDAGRKSITDADKATALYELSVKGLGKAHGDFARTGDSYANLQRKMSANWANLKVTIGKIFMPTFVNAMKFMNDQGFPALQRIAGVAVHVANSIRKIGTAALSSLGASFSTAIDKGTVSLGEIATWVETHQASILGFFVKIGDMAFGAARGVTNFVGGAIRGFGNLQGAIAGMLETAIPGILKLMDLQIAWENALGHDTAPLRAARDSIAADMPAMVEKLRQGKNAAYQHAAAFENKVNPALNKAQAAMHRVANQEVLKAKQRDAAARFANAVANVGNKGDYARLKLKGYNIENNRGTKAQREFGNRVKATRQRLIEKLAASQAAGAGQKKLTATWHAGRRALYREFLQMGYSKKEAVALAKKYSSVPKKVRTAVTQPGMKGAQADTKKLDDRINGLNSKTVKIMVALGKQGFSRKGLQETVDRRTAKGGRIPNRAAGGVLKGPGTGTSDSILGINDQGMPTSRVSNGEWVINAKSSKKYNALLEDINKDKLAKGGTVNRKITTKTKGLPKSALNLPAQANAVANEMAGRTWKAYQEAIQAMTSASGFSPGGGGKAIGRGQSALIRYARRLGMSASSYPGHHPSQSRARDFMPVSGGRGNKLAGHAKANHSAYNLWYIIWNKHIASKNHGWKWNRYTRYGNSGSPSQMHTNHVHVAWNKKGGMVGKKGLYTGGTFKSDGWAKVGERGPEIIRGNKGDRVTPTSESKRPLIIQLDGQKVYQGYIDDDREFQLAQARRR